MITLEPTMFDYWTEKFARAIDETRITSIRLCDATGAIVWLK